MELQAAFWGLQTYFNQRTNIHVRLQLDNTIAVAYINHMGGIQSPECNDIARNIWLWCIDRKLYVSAAHLPGSENVIADKRSRIFNDHTEWRLNYDIFKQITEHFILQNIDIFASRINYQLKPYETWQPDPGAFAVDALILHELG